MTLSEYIEKALNDAGERIKTNIDTQGVNASGKTKASIKVIKTEKGFALVGGGDDTAPIGTLETGRKAGNVPEGFEDILIQWARDKGISVDDEKAFARSLKWRIIKKGTLRNFVPSERKDIFSTVVTETLANIKENVGQYPLSTIKEYVRKLNFLAQ